MEDGEIQDTESGPEVFPAMKMGVESLDKKWTIGTSKTGEMYFYCIEKKFSIWLSDFRKTFNWKREKSSNAENELFYYFNPVINIAVWEDDFLHIQAICRTLSTPLSESRPISPEGAIPLTESPKTDPRQKLIKKMARTFKCKLEKIGLKVSKSTFKVWMASWLEVDEPERTDKRFYDLFVPKLGLEIVESHKANKKALSLLLGKKFKSKLTDKDPDLQMDMITKLLAKRLKRAKLASAIARCINKARGPTKPNNQS